MILSIQYLRAVAALLVVLHHAAFKGTQYANDPWEWFRIGNAGVDLFFIISGFIMCQTTQNKEVRFGTFIKARILRIIPLYWLLSFVALAVYLVAPEKVNSSGGTTSILHSFTLLPTASKYLIQNGWTLSYEFFFYFVFAFGLLFSTRLKHLVSVAILLSLVALGALTHPTGVGQTFVTNSLLLEFAMGIAAYHITLRYPLNRAFSALLVLVGIFLLTGVNVFGFWQDRWVYFGIPCFLIFWGLFGFEKFFVSHSLHPLSRWMKKIGDSSYSLYLVHPFALSIGTILLKRLGLTVWGNFFVLALVAGSVTAGLLCYFFCELPLSLKIKKLTQPSQK